MNPSKWVEDMEKMLNKTDPSAEMALWMKPSIYRVPERIMSTTKSQAYQPQLVSLGPFHNGKRHLWPMEEHKNRAVLHLVKRARKKLAEFIKAIDEVADELMDAYDVVEREKLWWKSHKAVFVEVMFRDGCFLLEMMRIHKKFRQGKTLEDYASLDPIFSIHGFHSFRSEIICDMILMENQLPLLVMKTILIVQRDKIDDKDINQMVLDFLGRRPYERDSLGLHPLHLYHETYRGLEPQIGRLDEWKGTGVSAVELSESRIQFKKSDTESVSDIDFNNGVLTMPMITVNDESEKIFRNLMAFERQYGRVGYDVTDYMIFMDRIINSERDVALLRSKGLIKTGLGSDKEVADLFNTLSKEAVMSPFSKLFDVEQQIHDHCRKPWNRWWAIFEHTYLRNPWVFISLIAAIILLVATVMQTIYAVLPFYKR